MKDLQWRLILGTIATVYVITICIFFWIFIFDAVLEPRRFGEEAGEVGFVSTLQDTASDVGQTFVVEDDETCQVMLEMVKLASILKEVAKDVRVGGHDGSRRYDGKLHETWTLSPRGWDRA